MVAFPIVAASQDVAGRGTYWGSNDRQFRIIHEKGDQSVIVTTYNAVYEPGVSLLEILFDSSVDGLPHPPFSLDISDGEVSLRLDESETATVSFVSARVGSDPTQLYWVGESIIDDRSILITGLRLEPFEVALARVASGDIEWPPGSREPRA